MTAQEQLMTQEELAFRWKISEATLERDRSLKQGCRYMKLGGLIRYRLQDVLDYENTCTHEPKAKLKEKKLNIGVLGMSVNVPVTPPAPQRKPLTDEEIIECDKIAGLNHTRHHRSIKGQQMSPADDFWWHFARSIEAAHGIK